MKFKADPAIESVDDGVALFPGIKSLAIQGGTPVEAVDGFKAHEVARKVGQFSFGGPEVKAALCFRYLLGDACELPMVG